VGETGIFHYLASGGQRKGGAGMEKRKGDAGSMPVVVFGTWDQEGGVFDGGKGGGARRKLIALLAHFQLVVVR